MDTKKAVNFFNSDLDLESYLSETVVKVGRNDEAYKAAQQRVSECKNRIPKLMQVLDLEDGTHSVLEWLAILVNNRVVNVGVPIAQAAIEYLTENFLIDLAPYDIVRGYRADDSYFSFVRSFVSNGLTVEQLETVMHLGSLGAQVVLKSPRAFERIRFVDYETAPWEEFHRRRLNRDMAARKAFFEESRRGVTQGLYMNTILSEGLKQDDVRV